MRSTPIGKVVVVSISKEKGVSKTNVTELNLVEQWGAQGDAHAGHWHRQVSLLASESIEKMRAKGLEVSPGDFAENITTEGLNLVDLPLGTKLRIGQEVVLEVSQIGKECHTGCAVFRQVGSCIMPKEGIFARVIRGGKVRPGDKIFLLEKDQL